MPDRAIVKKLTSREKQHSTKAKQKAVNKKLQGAQEKVPRRGQP